MSHTGTAPVLDSLRVLKGDAIHMREDLGKKVFVVEVRHDDRRAA